jgi:hypothetical protein
MVRIGLRFPVPRAAAVANRAGANLAPMRYAIELIGH